MLFGIAAFFSGVLKLTIVPYLFAPIFLFSITLIIIRIIRF